jgi:MoxR-like ATPase
MQEDQVTIAGKRHALPDPFFVLATQNPIEQEGTYPLPEAQLDRFMFMVHVDYPTEEEEFEIVKRTTSDIKSQITSTLGAADIKKLSEIVRRIPIADHVVQLALQLSRLTRKDNPAAPDFIKKFVNWGAGPRASQFLVLGAKARAALHGRAMATSDDVRAVSLPVLRHRIVTNFNAEAEGVRSDEIIARLWSFIENQQSKSNHGPLAKVIRS